MQWRRPALLVDQRPDGRATEPDRVEPGAAAAQLRVAEQEEVPQAAALASTDEIPVGGGIVLMDEKIVIVQPTAGQFVAWSAICKHEGETVGSVENNVITCLHHFSKYDSATGDVVAGPAPTGLDPVQIKVANGRITQA